MNRFVLLVMILGIAAPCQAQNDRQALELGTERYLDADYRAAIPLLSLGLNPSAGAGDELWRSGVERLADVLLVLSRDSLAAIWLRWARRIDEAFTVDDQVMPPAVVRASQAARVFVDSTPHDRFVTSVEYEWPSAFRSDAPAFIALMPAGIPITARVGTDQFMTGGETRRLAPGSYPIVISAPGYLPTRLTVEALPGVTSRVHASLLPETAGALHVMSRPWGTVFVDGEEIGNTPISGHRITPGRHALRVERHNASIQDTTILVADREDVRLSWVSGSTATGDAVIDSALVMLDAANLERATEILQDRLGASATLETAARATALARLAEAQWPVTSEDSVVMLLQEMVSVDPFYTPPLEGYNPVLRALYEIARRETAVIAIRMPADTVLRPLRDTLSIGVAVGQPGVVRVLLRFATPRPGDSVLAVLHVDSVATARIPLADRDSNVLLPGHYGLEAELEFRTRVSDIVQLDIERLDVDTVPHEPPVVTSYLTETRKGRPSPLTIVESLGLGALSVVVPIAINDRDLRDRLVNWPVLTIGVSVTTANLIFNRPDVPLPYNIQYNERLRAQRAEANRVIAAENAAARRRAPLRVRVSGVP